MTLLNQPPVIRQKNIGSEICLEVATGKPAAEVKRLHEKVHLRQVIKPILLQSPRRNKTVLLKFWFT